MRRTVYLFSGFAALALGGLGVFLPLLPTTPFVLLAAFCFARSSPRLERKLLEHPRFGRHIRDWRERGAISRQGKIAATVAFVASAAVGLIFLSAPWSLVPLAAGLVGGGWIWSRPGA